MSKALSTEEYLQVFLDHWEASRHAQLAKWRLQKNRYHDIPLLYDSASRKISHYEHELAMLKELRARSLP